MKSKEERFLAISEFIGKFEISSQEDLLHKLEADGFKLTQATLSRDLKMLQVIKGPGSDGRYIYRLPSRFNDAQERDADFQVIGFKSIEFSGNLGVIKTMSGFATGIAAVIDKHNSYEILGTIAGDDTILVILRENVSTKRVVSLLSSYISGIDKKIF